MEDRMATTHTTTSNLTLKIVPNDKGNPPGKHRDAELTFSDGVLAGLTLIGFGIWARRTGAGRNVTFPARQYAINGERRSFALLRPIVDATTQNGVRDAILEARDTSNLAWPRSPSPNGGEMRSVSRHFVSILCE
jgi:hypothetical protein